MDGEYAAIRATVARRTETPVKTATETMPVLAPIPSESGDGGGGKSCIAP